MTRHNLFYFLSLLILILFCNTSCEKIKYKDDFRAPLLGKYVCTVKAYNTTLSGCYENELLAEKISILKFAIHGDSELVIKPLLSFKYNIEDLPYDTLRFYAKNKFWGNGDSVYVFTNMNLNGDLEPRDCSLTITSDSFYLSIHEGCPYIYRISGKKLK